MSARAILLAATAGLILGSGLAACGDGDDSGDEASAPATSSEQTTTADPPAGGADGDQAGGSTAARGPLPGAALTPSSRKPATDSVALLTDVRPARHDGFDRVVFEFRDGKMPGYDVRYVDRPVVQDGSGTPVTIRGEAVVLVRMLNALDADLTDDEAPATYTGPRRLKPDSTASIVELTRVSGFEGELSWAVGVRQRVPFQVTELSDPARLVIDFLHE